MLYIYTQIQYIVFRMLNRIEIEANMGFILYLKRYFDANHDNDSSFKLVYGL